MTTETTAPENVIAPDPSEERALRDLNERLDEIGARGGTAKLVGSDGEEIAMPSSALDGLRRIVTAMSRGLTVTVVPHGRELTTRQAAELLHVSRPFLVRKLLGTEIPYEMVGSHRRVRLDDVLRHRELRAAARRRLLDEMSAAAQEVEGGYR